jgi:hypothetical protein
MAEMTVRRVGVLSLAKIQALLSFVIGLIIGVLEGLIIMLFGVAMSSMAPGSQGQAAGGSVVFGLIIMIAIPIMAGIFGFIAGAINGFVYNLGAGVFGGLKLELEGSPEQYTPPPPPQQWGPG